MKLTDLTITQAKDLLKKNPKYALEFYINGESEFQYKADKRMYPYNSSYTSAWCANNHIVGINQQTNSTIGSTISTKHLFDTKKIMTEKQYGELLQTVLQNYGNLTASLVNIVEDNNKQF